MPPKNAAAAVAADALPPGNARSAAASIDAADVKQILTDAKPVVALLASEIWAREAGVKFNTWEVVPPVGTSKEHILAPKFWANVARKMKMGDTLIVVPRDGAWHATLVVWDAGQNWAHVSGTVVDRPAFDQAPGVDSEFDIVTDPVDGVCVKRNGGAVIKKNFPNSEDARRWILDHQKALRT
jgi:hypothetical protein